MCYTVCMAKSEEKRDFASTGYSRLQLILTMMLFGTIGTLSRFISMPSSIICLGRAFFGAVIILILYSWANLIKIKYAGFLVNYANTAKINVLLTLVSCLLPFVLFILGNWAVGTLINGKGNMKQVLKVTAYSLYPTVFLYVIGVIVSQGIIFEERMFVQFLFYFPMVMFAFYCFIGLIMVHQFTFTKGIGSVLLSAVAIVILIFVIVLLVTLVSGFINDLFTIWDEIALYYL